MTMQGLGLALIALVASCTHAFVVPNGNVQRVHSPVATTKPWGVVLQESLEAESSEPEVVDVVFEYGPEERKSIIELIQDDAWAELAMRVAETVREEVIGAVEQFKASEAGKLTEEMLMEMDARAKDLARDIDARAKLEVARLRGKEVYELGDLVKVMDELAKEKVCELTGKDDYEFGDLSIEIDKRIKAEAARLVGKEEYDLADLIIAVDDLSEKRIREFSEAGLKTLAEISATLEKDREQWAKDFFGEEAVKDFKDLQEKIKAFGDMLKD